jgi:hypothetical protein
MIDEWRKYRGWMVLEFFLLNPDSRIHINELSRRLQIGSQTAQQFCKSYLKDGLLNLRKIGNIHQYSLNEKDARARALKLFIGSYLVADPKYLEPFLKKNKNILSISIYGSFAKGDYGDKSDLDILVITSDDRNPDTKVLCGIEHKLGREVGISVIPIDRWREMERKKKNFFHSIKNNHTLIWGERI